MDTMKADFSMKDSFARVWRHPDGVDRPYPPQDAQAEKTLAHQIGGDHYRKRAIQPIEFVMANGLGFCEGNVVKYVTRWRDKNGVEDLKKARQYLDFLIEDAEKKGDKPPSYIVRDLDENTLERIKKAHSSGCVVPVSEGFGVVTGAPAGYTLTPGPCACPHLWNEGGRHFCCNGQHDK